MMMILILARYYSMPDLVMCEGIDCHVGGFIESNVPTNQVSLPLHILVGDRYINLYSTASLLVRAANT